MMTLSCTQKTTLEWVFINTVQHTLERHQLGVVHCIELNDTTSANSKNDIGDDSDIASKDMD